MEEEGESYSYLNDLSGSVMRLSGNGRDSAASYRYDEFGKDLSGNQGQFQPFGYTGYQRDAVAGTYYAQAREYDAGSGRFTSEDVVKGSAAYPETLNAYGYCWGNPLVFVDRDGREPEEAYTYDRDAVIEYADKWTKGLRGANYVFEYLFSKRNSDYYSYSTNCANFVSQCVEAGGVEMNDEWHSHKTITTSIWISGSGNHYAETQKISWDVSAPWRLAQDQYDYFSDPQNGYINGDTIEINSVGEIEDVVSNNNVQKGDLMYFVDEKGNVHHATMISKVENGMIYFTGNTKRRFNMPLKDALDGDSVIIVRINDEIEFKKGKEECEN